MWSLTDYANHTHNENINWWRNPATGEPIERNYGEMIALCHSELSESLEGHRKNLQDDKLPQYPMCHVELVDCLIRIFDILGAQNVNVEKIYLEKMAYNKNRADHKPENRIKEGGKAY